MTAWLRCGMRALALASLASTAACSSSDSNGSSGGPGTGSSDDSCGIAITLSGASNTSLDVADTQGCVLSTGGGAFIAFAPPSNSDLAAIALSVSALMPGQTATALPAGLTLHHDDGTDFDPTGCSIDVTENSLVGMVDGESNYRVSGTGSCAGPGVVDTRSISVVGLFRFVATLGWQN